VVVTHGRSEKVETAKRDFAKSAKNVRDRVQAQQR